MRDLAGRFLKAKAQAEVEEVGPLVRLLFEDKHHILGQLLLPVLAGWSWDPCFFLDAFLHPVIFVFFFLCDFDRRSRDEKMNAEKRRERRNAKKSSKKKNDFSSSTRSSCSFSGIFGWICFFFLLS